jgi:hypothetical protein
MIVRVDLPCQQQQPARDRRTRRKSGRTRQQAQRQRIRWSAGIQFVIRERIRMSKCDCHLQPSPNQSRLNKRSDSNQLGQLV